MVVCVGFGFQEVITKGVECHLGLGVAEELVRRKNVKMISTVLKWKRLDYWMVSLSYEWRKARLDAAETNWGIPGKSAKM